MKIDIHNLVKNRHKRALVFLCAIFCIGMVMIVISSTRGKETITEQNPKNTEPESSDTLSYSEQIEKKLEEEFAKIDGVGRVRVAITIKSNGEIVLNKDAPSHTIITNEADSEGGNRDTQESDVQASTVLVKQSDGSEEPIVIKELMPEVSGVLIIAEGGDDIIVKNRLIQAAKVLLDLPAHKIEVMKMVSE